MNKRFRKIAYRLGKWKYIYNENKPDELYNLARDPKETKKLVNDETDVACLLLSGIIEHLKWKKKHPLFKKRI